MLDLKEIKEIQLSILKEVHNFCIKNGIHYSLAHGTLLGAVRHGGFIPWDDDIDICLLEKDYELFMKSFSHPYINALCIENDKRCPYPYGKVYDSRTVIQEDANVSYNLGVNIDVFPIYHYPDNAFKAGILKLRLFVLSWIYNIKVIRISKRRGVIKNILLVLLKLFCLPVRFLWLTGRIRKVCLNVDCIQTLKLFETRSAKTVVYDVKSFDGFDIMEFEGNYFNVMKGWHNYLSKRHGDYMKLPPENKQVPHHRIKAYWKYEKQ